MCHKSGHDVQIYILIDNHIYSICWVCDWAILTLLVIPVGFEPTTYGLENRCSIHWAMGPIFSNISGWWGSRTPLIIGNQAHHPIKLHLAFVVTVILFIIIFILYIKSSELWDSNPLSFTWIKTNHVNQRLMFEQTFGLEPKSHDYKSRILPIELWMHYFLSENRESNPKN